MATMNISLLDQTKDGKYANPSDYVRDLIRRELLKRKKIAAMQEKIDEAYSSGFHEVDDLPSYFADLKKQAGL